MKNKKQTFVPNSLRRCRKVRGLKQKEVADILGLKSTSMISRWEGGLCLPETMNVFRLAIIYRTTSDGLFFDFIKALRARLLQKEEEVIKLAIHEKKL